MKKIIIILVLFSVCFAAYAFRLGTPPRITDINDKNAIAQLNLFLEDMQELSKGRYTLDIVTTNPDGTRNGDVGDIILFNNSGTYYLEVNTTGSTVWRGVVLADTP